ncbi:MAG: hypothetical protein FD166_1234 [Bacteroidetes bacterium]|nr:MAG: hypothetical protein FD166_1234 [Bacteroidota bacterium]
MENLIIDLKEKLILRKECEIKKIQYSDKDKDDKIILIAIGRIFEIDNIIRGLDNMLKYYNQTKKIAK